MNSSCLYAQRLLSLHSVHTSSPHTPPPTDSVEEGDKVVKTAIDAFGRIGECCAYSVAVTVLWLQCCGYSVVLTVLWLQCCGYSVVVTVLWLQCRDAHLIVLQWCLYLHQTSLICCFFLLQTLSSTTLGEYLLLVVCTRPW